MSWQLVDLDLLLPPSRILTSSSAFSRFWKVRDRSSSSLRVQTWEAAVTALFCFGQKSLHGTWNVDCTCHTDKNRYYNAAVCTQDDWFTRCLLRSDHPFSGPSKVSKLHSCIRPHILGHVLLLERSYGLCRHLFPILH